MPTDNSKEKADFEKSCKMAVEEIVREHIEDLDVSWTKSNYDYVMNELGNKNIRKVYEILGPMNLSIMANYKFPKSLPLEEIKPYEAMKGADIRQVKQRLALEATAIIHGREAAVAADAAAKAVFTGATSADMPTHASALPELVSTLLADSGLVKSRGEGRRLIQSGAVKVDYGNGKEGVTDTHASLEEEAVLWAGKKKSVRVVRG